MQSPDLQPVINGRVVKNSLPCERLLLFCAEMDAHSVTVDQLPDDVLAVIFSSFPSFLEVGRGVARVNKHWAAISHDADIWMHYWNSNDLGEMPTPEARHAGGMYNLFRDEVTVRRRWLRGGISHTGTFNAQGMNVLITHITSTHLAAEGTTIHPSYVPRCARPREQQSSNNKYQFPFCLFLIILASSHILCFSIEGRCGVQS